MGELTLMAWAWESWPPCRGCRRSGGLTNSTISQARIQVSGLAYSNLCPIYELLKFMKGSVPWIHSHRNFMTQRNSRMSESLCEDSILTV